MPRRASWCASRGNSSCGSPLEGVARRLLRKRQGEIESKGRVVGPDIEGTTYADIEQALLQYFDFAGKYTDPHARHSVLGRLAHLRRHFGLLRGIEISA